MNERQYFAARKRVEEDYHRKLRSLETTWELLHGKAPPKPKRSDKNEHSTPLIAALREALADMPGEFNTLEIDKIVRAVHPEITYSRSSVSHTLKRIAGTKNPPIEIVEIGKGKRPTKYRRLPAEAMTDAVAEPVF